MKFGQFMYYKRKIFMNQDIQRKMWPGNQFQAVFKFQRILCKKIRGLHADLDKFW